MASVNKAIIIGHLGKDPETRYTANGDAICNITIATSESWKDKTSGEKKERTEWHRVVFYRRLAEIAGQYLKKGSQVYIEGSIHTRKWTDKEGHDRYTTEIQANEMTMLGGRSGSGDADRGESAGHNAPHDEQEYNQAAAAPAATANKKAAAFDDLDDDIPF